MILRWIIDWITNCLLDVLMSYQPEIEFCYRGSKIRYLIWNLQQNHSSFCDTMNMCTINLFVFSNLVSKVSWIFSREEGAFLLIKKPTCSGNEVVFSYSVRIDFVVAKKKNNKKIKNSWVKKTKKLRKRYGFIENSINLPLQ